MEVSISLQTDNHTSTPPLSFLQAGCHSCRPTNSFKALKARHHVGLHCWWSIAKCDGLLKKNSMLDCKTHFNGVITVVLLPALNTRVYNNVAPTDLWSDYYTGSAKAEVLVALQRINNKMCQPVHS